MSDAHVAGPTTAIGLDAPAAVRALATGYQPAQMVYVATTLGIADLLASGPRSADELASATSAHAPSLRRLLRALAAFGILAEVEPERFALTSLGECLRADSPDSVRGEVLMWGSDTFWQTWRDLLHSVRTGETAIHHLYGFADSFDYYARHPDVAATMNTGFRGGAAALVRAVVAAYDFAASTTVVDVGGGQGHLIGAILRAYPMLRGVLFDLPHVIASAGPVFAGLGVADRCTLVAGDVFTEVPVGGDIYILSRVIHDWDDERATTILRNCRQSMAPGARLLLAERVLPNRVEASFLAQRQLRADINMLVRTGGHERTDDEFRDLFTASGFALARMIPASEEFSIVEGIPA